MKQARRLTTKGKSKQMKTLKQTRNPFDIIQNISAEVRGQGIQSGSKHIKTGKHIEKHVTDLNIHIYIYTRRSMQNQGVDVVQYVGAKVVPAELRSRRLQSTFFSLF